MQKSAAPIFDHAAAARFMERNGLTIAEFVRHSGVPYSTLRAVMIDGRKPTAAVAERLVAALVREPAPPLDRSGHGDTIRVLWGNHNSDDIGLRCDPQISGARVRAIAKRLGLPAGGTRARKQAAE